MYIQLNARVNEQLFSYGAPLFKIKRPPFFNYIRNLGIFA